MRRIYYGKNATGKSRICKDIAIKCRDSKLKVISNVPNIDFETKNIDPYKIEQLCRDDVLERLYKHVSMEDYPNFNYPQLTQSYIRNILEYLVYEGDVLVLDDIDNRIPYLVLISIMRCLSREGYLADAWKHIIIAGYSLFLRHLITDEEYNDDKDSGIYFVNKDDEIVKLKDYDDLENWYAEVVYE